AVRAPGPGRTRCRAGQAAPELVRPRARRRSAPGRGRAPRRSRATHRAASRACNRRSVRRRARRRARADRHRVPLRRSPSVHCIGGRAPRNNVERPPVDYSGEVARLRPQFAAMFAVLALTAGASSAYAAPPAPTGLATNPLSPASVAGPKVTGSAQASTTVNLYRTSNCSGTVIVSGSSSALGGSGFQGGPLSGDGTYSFSATATD